LGDAPQAGSHRTFDRADVLQEVRGSAELAALLEIPPSMTITRWSRPLTREEVAVAIRKSLQANDALTGLSLSAGDIKFDSPIAVTEVEPALTVMRLEPRSANAGTHVALWTASEPRTPPFWVIVDKEIDEPLTLNREKLVAGSKAAAKTQIVASAPEQSNGVMQAGAEKPAAIRYLTRPATPSMSPNRAPTASESPLIRVGNPIQLVVQGSGMRITAKATALETGREGQQIRVKCEPAGKVLVARVVAAQLAEIDY
jgi:hypothetical protein